ncbi:MAG: tetratricopeptide repeat protein [Candidatus Koribacter versatilis]|uniref:Tetratricopeptide repeat protein n=1 Tax=Candidatus Korobacter versatilis TaxID=658062 RepID=A0A932A753_9BACT|nr:tetratricopeptide repeat protein [Candidatus Koribacter versatilis]
MRFAHRPLRRAGLLLAILCLSLSAGAAEKARLQVDDYQIDVDLMPQTHRLTAKAKIKFTATDDINTAVFELHNAMRVNKVTDAGGKPLQSERVTQDSTIRVPLPAGLNKGQSSQLNFEYEGLLSDADDSPVEGLKLAHVGEDSVYLLYAGRWFPLMGYGVDRFTATINVTVPTGMKVIGSGASAARPATPAAPRAAGAGKSTYTFVWDRASFPGTILAGNYQEFKGVSGGMTVNVFFTPQHKAEGPAYADTAARESEYFASLYGPAPSRTLNLVELPTDTVPTAWAPEIAAITGNAVSPKTNYRLLANVISHQWWGVSLSPASKADMWLSDGFARYSEMRYVEFAAGQAGLEEAAKDMAVGALAYDNVPLAQVSKLDTFSPEFQSLVSDKGGMILHMLRWVLSDAVFDRTMRAFAMQYAGKSVTAEDFRKLAEGTSGQRLTAFFTQWLDSTGAPEFKNKYTIYRLGNNKGFRVSGQISQDLDLFSMPLELRVDTDGKTEMKRITVSGTESPYVVETFGKPRRITLDPYSRVLKNSPELKVRASILRGQQLVREGDLTEALKEFQKALDANKASSLAHYRIAEVFFLQKNYQSAANEYRESLNGDGDPRWTEVWSHIQLGKIFDVTGQRERATNEYRQALQTNDNTQGALDEARRFLQAPYSQNADRNGN